MTPVTHLAMPTPPLRPVVSHYWLSGNNQDGGCRILPDGSVDLVLAVQGANWTAEVHGTTSRAVTLPLASGAHYLGVTFRPGQAGLLLAATAPELTDRVVPAAELLTLDLEPLAASLQPGPGASVAGLFGHLDRILVRGLPLRPAGAMNRVLDLIDQAETPPDLQQLAETYGRSVRQFQRRFLEQTGLPAKLYMDILRFRRASRLVRYSTLPLADIAAVLGYTDQSHMVRVFQRFCGEPPSRHADADVAFLQDGPACPPGHSAFLSNHRE